MEHGSAAYFLERAHSARRVVLTALAVGTLLLAPMLFSYARPFRSRADRMRDDLRFGILGDQARYVRRIILEAAPGPDAALRDVGKVASRAERRGGSPRPRRPATEPGKPEFRPPIEGVGESFENLLARALARRSNVPVVPSDQLVIKELVRPVYPEDAREKNIEGRVSVLALVDTLGEVVEVEVVRRDAHESLIRAAITAVWQCRFQPYRIEGRPTEVYVVMPFNFTIY